MRDGAHQRLPPTFFQTPKQQRAEDLHFAVCSSPPGLNSLPFAAGCLAAGQQAVAALAADHGRQLQLKPPAIGTVLPRECMDPEAHPMLGHWEALRRGSRQHRLAAL